MDVVSFNIARKLSSKEIREKIRLEQYNNHTSGLALINFKPILSFYLMNTQVIFINFVN